MGWLRGGHRGSCRMCYQCRSPLKVVSSNLAQSEVYSRGGSRWGVHPARAPLKLEKIWFFCVKSWFFTRNTQNILAPPFARRNFFKCLPPLTWNPGSSPVLGTILCDKVCRVGGFLRVLLFLPPIKLTAMMKLKYCWKWS